MVQSEIGHFTWPSRRVGRGLGKANSYWRLAGLSDAGSGDISFLTNKRYAKAVESTGASAVIVASDWEGDAPCALVRVENPDKAFMLAAQSFAPADPDPVPAIDPSAVVNDKAEVDPGATVGPLCVIEEGAKIGSGTVLVAGCYVGREAQLGSNCFLHANVSVRERVQVGDRTIIHCGAVIGSDGFGYVKEGEAWKKIPQVGIVVLGDDVEIGANVTIDRARFGKTVIGNGAKIDNLVQIAHNVNVGENAAMAAQVGIAGSAVVGKNVQLGGQAGVSGHVRVGDNTIVGGQSGVTKDVDANKFVSGLPALPHRDTMRMHANALRIPALKQKIAEIEKKMKDLEDSTEAGGEQ